MTPEERNGVIEECATLIRIRFHEAKKKIEALDETASGHTAAVVAYNFYAQMLRDILALKQP